MLHTYLDLVRALQEPPGGETEFPSIAQPESFNWVRDVFEGIHVAERGSQAALIWTDDQGTARTYSYDELRQECDRTLAALRSSGLKSGDRLFVMLSQRPELWITYLAAIKGGLVLVPSAPILSTDDLAYRLKTVAPAAFITDLSGAKKADDALSQSGNVSPLRILVGDQLPGWTPFLSENPILGAVEAIDTHGSDPLFLFFTSGTTGMPKVAVHTHASYPLGHLSTAAWIGIRPGDVHYNIAQPGWAKFAWSSFFAPWNVGATILTHQAEGRFNPKRQLQLLQDQRVTTFCAPPTALRMLIQEDMTAYDLQLRECVSAGEPLNPEVIDAWEAGTGIRIRDGYGQSESTAMIANLPGSQLKAGSMGKPLFLYDIAIANEDGQELPDGQEGWIAVRLHPETLRGLFDSYLNQPEKTGQVFRHGLYYTGDKAYRDNDGYIWFVGRDDDVIKSSDYRIGPFEVESAMQRHPLVLESAVVGTPHAVKGTEVKAFVTLVSGTLPSQENADTLFKHASSLLSPYKLPRAIEFVSELPKTVSGKIRRAELRDQEKNKAQPHPHEYRPSL